jgi:hypothetical protein
MVIIYKGRALALPCNKTGGHKEKTQIVEAGFIPSEKTEVFREGIKPSPTQNKKTICKKTFYQELF